MKIKKNIVFIVCGVIAIGLITVGLVMLLNQPNDIAVKDSEGNVFATFTYDDSIVSLNLENDSLKECAYIAFEEAVSKISDEYSLEEDEATKKLFKKADCINTTIQTDFVPNLKNGVEENIKKANTSIVLMTPDGKILAGYTNSPEAKSFCNQKTYLGSTIKPVSVYAPAINSGEFSWSSMFVDSPVSVAVSETGETTDWPSNSDGKYTEENVPLCKAIAYSVNTVAVKLLKEYGVTESINHLSSIYGFDVSFEKEKAVANGEDEVLSAIGLGYLYGGVSNIQIAGSYQTFANRGYYTKPYSVVSISNNDSEIYTATIKKKQVYSASTASIMQKMLKNVVVGGTGREARLDGVEVCGKTGTTEGYSDNLFVGFTPEYICSVYHEKESDSGNLSTKIFSTALKGIPHTETEFKTDKSITRQMYCEKTGLLRGGNCKECELGYYSKKSLPAICTECN